jgi:hypothetical protein
MNNPNSISKFIDQYRFSTSSDKEMEEIKEAIFNRIKNSNTLVLNNLPYQNSINVQSKKLEWMTSPMLPIFRAKIKLDNSESNRVKIKVELKGNALFCFFKYMGLILFIVFASVWIVNIIKPFDEFYNESILSSLGPLAGFFIFNFMNRNHIITGREEILKLVNF